MLVVWVLAAHEPPSTRAAWRAVVDRARRQTAEHTRSGQREAIATASAAATGSAAATHTNRLDSPADRAHIKEQRGAIWAWLRGLGGNLIK